MVRFLISKPSTTLNTALLCRLRRLGSVLPPACIWVRTSLPRSNACVRGRIHPTLRLPVASMVASCPPPHAAHAPPPPPRHPRPGTNASPAAPDVLRPQQERHCHADEVALRREGGCRRFPCQRINTAATDLKMRLLVFLGI